MDDVIVVTGFRQSLANSVSAKRNSDGVTDSIFAEDIGKATDQNIGEALSRITGVSLQREDGEGTTVSVRGVGADLNNITLNGVSLTSSGGNQAVNLSEFSSDILNSIEVLKTSSADQDEGSLGATIRLQGFRPLGARRDRASVEIQGRYNEFADADGFEVGDFADDYKINGAFSKKLFDEKVGFSIIASSETQETRVDLLNTGGFQRGTFNNGVIDVNTGDALGDVNVAHSPRFSRYTFQQGQRDRDTITTTLQFQPGNDWDLQFDYTFSDQLVARDSSFIQANGNTNNPVQELAIYDPESLTITGNTVIPGRIAGGRGRRPGVVTNARTNLETVQQNNVFSGRITKEAGPFEFELRGGHSETTSVDENFFSASFNLSVANGAPAIAAEEVETGYTCSAETNFQLCNIILNDFRTDSVVPLADNAEQFQFQRVNFRNREVEDRATSLYFDMDWDVDLGPVTSFEAGAKWSDRSKLSASTVVGRNRNDCGGDIGDLFLNLTQSGESVPGDFGSAIGLPRDTVTDGWALIDLQQTFDQAAELSNDMPSEGSTNLNSCTGEAQPNPRDTFDLSEEILGFYTKVNFEFLGGTLRGDIGARLVETSTVSNGSSGLELAQSDFGATADEQYYINAFGSEAAARARLGGELAVPVVALPIATESASYTNFLPSFNLNWAAKEDLILRFAASRTMARPRLQDLDSSITLREQPFLFVSNGVAGNPALRPFLSTNLDFSAEWYFKEDSLFSVALFNKDLQDFTETIGRTTYYRDIRSDLYNADGTARTDIAIEVTPESLLLPVNESSFADCFPNREGQLLPNGNGNTVGAPGCDELNLRQVRNGSGGYVRGIEASLQHSFTELPGFLGGMGFQLNYTYADSRAEEEIGLNDAGLEVIAFPEAPLLQTSKHTFNGTIFYEQDGKLIRLAYNTRSDFLILRSDNLGFARWGEGTDSLDLSLGYDLTDNLTFTFQGVNLTDDVRREYVTYSNTEDADLPFEELSFDTPNQNRTFVTQNSGRIFRVGLRYNF